MSKQLKVIWDFRGPASQRTAEHFVIHLEEYLKGNTLKSHGHGSEIRSDMIAIAFLIIGTEDLEQVKNELKPHRAEWVETPSA